jgi:DNA-binding winged helix-turn-helix (wHTH) protein
LVRFRLGNHLLDGELRELTRDGVAVPVQPQVFDLLLFLVESRDRLVSKDDLVAKVWGNRPISDSALNSRINAARNALQDDGKAQRMIRTVPRKGFRFVGDCVELAPAASAAAPPAPAVVAADRPAIAVLAFNNMSDDAEQEYFCDGISEEILRAGEGRRAACHWSDFVIFIQRKRRGRD